ncbi:MULTISPECIES: RagB/SusD family nutrient uptake outer membrane protein [unclassified Saccharicrinis]|uniref:RagB/SusD family nutrient uptake outer membrane protein n=1 Tax=unclassified Saccharicrinis TaxID=2646859 RepID=UPI003D3347D8
MKKRNKIFCIIPFVLLLLLTTTGCEDAFDNALAREADSRESIEGMLGDATKVKGMFHACYQGIPKSRVYLYFWTTEEALTDNCFDQQAQSMGNWRNGNLSPSNGAVWAGERSNTYSQPNTGSWWGRYWGGIHFCNVFLENLPQVTVSDEELPQAERDLMREEVIALRAYFHFKLISMYGPLPFIDFVFPLEYDGWKDMTRPTYDEVANRIAEELQGVIDRGILPMKRDPSNVTDKYRMPLGFVYGLKSRVLLYNASPLNNPDGDVNKYEKAAAAAKQFLDLGAYSLEPWENTKKMYISEYSVNLEATEVIWRARDRVAQLSNVQGINLGKAVPKKSNFTIVKCGETPTQEMVDCYELKNGAMVVQEYDATHANPTFTPEALAAGYDDYNAPYENRDDRLSRDIMYNGNNFGQSYQMGAITVWTYKGAPGTGTNGNVTSGSQRQTYTGYYYGKDRDPLFYGKGSKGAAFGRVNHHSMMMRYAEIYLNYAEALCGAGHFDEACYALDMTRVRANQPPISSVPDYQSGNTDWLMRRIRNERRVELVLEDHRFYDVRRWDIISNTQNNTVSGMLVEKVGAAYTHTRYQTPWVWACHNEKYKVLPIPLVDGKYLPNLEQPEAWQ